MGGRESDGGGGEGRTLYRCLRAEIRSNALAMGKPHRSVVCQEYIYVAVAVVAATVVVVAATVVVAVASAAAAAVVVAACKVWKRLGCIHSPAASVRVSKSFSKRSAASISCLDELAMKEDGIWAVSRQSRTELKDRSSPEVLVFPLTEV